ncbi:MAG: XRE family transcriptional regulator [Candidatus Pacebacteria bacterium]|nr:XRE family transcriptional regulator [Candidatus Paceibacterota bacterium]
MFNPDKLAIARDRRGLTKIALAEKLGITRETLQKYENGDSTPSQDIVLEMSKSLDFPVEWFFGENVTKINISGVSFRSLGRMSAANRNSALASGSIALLVNAWFDAKFNLPKLDLPDLSDSANAESAASELRAHWNIGNLSIKNMIHLLESKGIRVFSLEEENKEVDAFSFWRDNTPFIFLNTFKSAERSRFDAAHELGHLVLHRHEKVSGKDVEKQANSFASAFLMPESHRFSELSNYPSLEELVKSKRKWNVSVAALAYRLNKIGKITEWQYKELSIELSKRGYRSNEPEPIPREVSQIFPKIFAYLREDGITKRDISRELHINSIEIDKILFGLLLTSINNEQNIYFSTPKKGKLRVVK